MLYPFIAAHYSKKNLEKIGSLAVSDLDTVEHLWGAVDSSLAFRNVLVGPPEQRGELWQSWISSSEIVVAEDSLYYVLHHVEEADGHKIDRWAVFGAIQVDDPLLYIHEDVLPEGVERARQGAEACESDMASVFVGCDEATGASLRKLLPEAVAGKEPMLRYLENSSSVHELWALNHPATEGALKKLFADAPLFLLDGHHRLAAARENARLGIGDGKILACVCSMAPTDTLILPIHRAVSLDRWMLADAMEADLVRAGCRTRELSRVHPQTIQESLRDIKPGEAACIALHGHSDRPLLVQLPAATHLPEALASLAVACLDEGVLAKIQGARSMPVAAIPLALELLALDQAQVAFFLPPVSPAQVRAVAAAKLKMPRKSTRFVPKPPLGLICRPWELA